MAKKQKDLGRREFLGQSTKLAVGASVLGMFAAASQANTAAGKKLKVVLVGTGSRGITAWGKDFALPYSDYVEMVGLCDINPKRVEYAKNYIGIKAPTYLAKNFDRMIHETKPDAVVITTPDCFHAQYAIRAMELQVACENEDGYLRDGCVWDNDNDTYDTMTVEVKYNNGVLLSYSLNAFMPYEGQSIAFNGEKGRLDVRLYHRQPWEVEHHSDFRLTKNFKDTKTWHVEPGQGEHGGADEKLKDMLFKPNQQDPLGKMAGSRAGVMSSLVGIAARKSIETGEQVKIADLVDFPLVWKM